MLLGHEKINFLYLPTPLERLNNLSQDLGINLYIKRDDLTPLAMGGNKLRKLEYLLADAKKQGATMMFNPVSIFSLFSRNISRISLAI